MGKHISTLATEGTVTSRQTVFQGTWTVFTFKIKQRLFRISAFIRNATGSWLGENTSCTNTLCKVVAHRTVLTCTYGMGRYHKTCLYVGQVFNLIWHGRERLERQRKTSWWQVILVILITNMEITHNLCYCWLMFLSCRLNQRGSREAPGREGRATGQHIAGSLQHQHLKPPPKAYCCTTSDRLMLKPSAWANGKSRPTSSVSAAPLILQQLGGEQR